MPEQQLATAMAPLSRRRGRGAGGEGLPPRDDDEWEYARQVFTKAAVNEMARWAVELGTPFPPDLDPPGRPHPRRAVGTPGGE